MKPTGLQRAVYKLILNSKIELDSYEIAEKLIANQRCVFAAIKSLIEMPSTDIKVNSKHRRTKYKIGKKTPCSIIFPVLPTDLARLVVLTSDSPVSIKHIISAVGCHVLTDSQARSSLNSLAKEYGAGFTKVRINGATHYHVDKSLVNLDSDEMQPTEVNAVDLIFSGNWKQAIVNNRVIAGI